MLLAQRSIERQGSTLSDACRELIEKLAIEQAKYENQDAWVTEQVNAAFARLERGEEPLVSNDSINRPMAAKKSAYCKSV